MDPLKEKFYANAMQDLDRAEAELESQKDTFGDYYEARKSWIITARANIKKWWDIATNNAHTIALIPDFKTQPRAKQVAILREQCWNFFNSSAGQIQWKAMTEQTKVIVQGQSYSSDVDSLGNEIARLCIKNE